MATVEPGICGGECQSMSAAADRRARADCNEKKTAEIIRQEISREVEHLLHLLFSEQRNRGGLDLEAVEMAIRSAMHRAGASTLSQLLQFEIRGRSSGNSPAPAAIPPVMWSYVRNRC